MNSRNSKPVVVMFTHTHNSAKVFAPQFLQDPIVNTVYNSDIESYQWFWKLLRAKSKNCPKCQDCSGTKIWYPECTGCQLAAPCESQHKALDLEDLSSTSPSPCLLALSHSTHPFCPPPCLLPCNVACPTHLSDHHPAVSITQQSEWPLN